MNYKNKSFSVSMAGGAADQDELDRRWAETFGPRPMKHASQAQLESAALSSGDSTGDFEASRPTGEPIK